MFSSRLISLLLLAVAVVGSPVVVDQPPMSMALLKEYNITSGTAMVESGRQRAQALRAAGHGHGHGHHGPINVPVSNEGVTYSVGVGVGSPATNYKIIVDTGSSNTWVGADPGKRYVPSGTSQATPDGVQVVYGSGFFTGREYYDQIALDKLVIRNQSIGAATLAVGFDGYDGILGVGPTILTRGSLFSPVDPAKVTTETIPTVTDNLVSEGTIKERILGISFVPAPVKPSDGVLTFGGTDRSRYTGDLHNFPKTMREPATFYWGYDQSISYGDTEILPLNAGITDTGTTLIYMASDAYQKYMKATGAKQDNMTGLLSITAEQFNNLKSLFFNIHGTTYEFTRDAQLWPRSMNAAIGGTKDGYYLIIADIGSDSGQGFDFINGYAFLERFYSAYDTDNSRIGFAATNYTEAVVNSSL